MELPFYTLPYIVLRLVTWRTTS